MPLDAFDIMILDTIRKVWARTRRPVTGTQVYANLSGVVVSEFTVYKRLQRLGTRGYIKRPAPSPQAIRRGSTRGGHGWFLQAA